LAVPAAELGGRLAGPPRRARDDREAVCVHRHGAAHREIAVCFGHVPAGHHQQLVHVGRAGDDGFRARDHDAACGALDDMHVGIAIGLLVRAQRTVALAVGHCHAEREVAGVDPLQVSVHPRAVFGVELRIHAMRSHPDRGHCVAAQVALRAAGVLAYEAHRLQLVQQILARRGDRHHPVDLGGRAGRRGAHHRHQLLAQREVVGEPDRVHAGRQRRLVGNRGDRVPVDEHARLVTPQGFAVIRGGHQHGGSPALGASKCSR
jgi:hypothetical protein